MVVFMVVSKILKTEPWESNEDDGSTSRLKATKNSVVGLLVRHDRGCNGNKSDNEESVNGKIE